MDSNIILKNLKDALEPYLFFRDEWLSSDNHTLTVEEITKISFYLNKNFKVNFLSELTFYKEKELLLVIIKKLELGYPVFREFVVVNFLFEIIKMAHKYDDGYDALLLTPIKQLKINEEIKLSLLAFSAHTLQFLFIAYKAEEFSRGWLYKNVVKFQLCKKKHGLTLTSEAQSL